MSYKEIAVNEAAVPTLQTSDQRREIAIATGELVFGDGRNPDDARYQGEPNDPTLARAYELCGDDPCLYLVMHGVFRSRESWSGATASGGTMGVLYDRSRLELAEGLCRLFEANGVDHTQELGILKSGLPGGYKQWVQSPEGRL